MKTKERNKKEIETGNGSATSIDENGKLNSADEKINRIENIKDKYNDRHVIDIQELVFDIDNIFDAIYHTTLSTDYNKILSDEDLKFVIMTLAKIGRERAKKIEDTF